VRSPHILARFYGPATPLSSGPLRSVGHTLRDATDGRVPLCGHLPAGLPTPPARGLSVLDEKKNVSTTCHPRLEFCKVDPRSIDEDQPESLLQLIPFIDRPIRSRLEGDLQGAESRVMTLDDLWLPLGIAQRGHLASTAFCR